MGFFIFLNYWLQNLADFARIHLWKLFQFTEAK